MLKRRGFTLLEIGAAGVMLAIMLVVCVRFFRATAAQRRGLRDRQIALQQADNVMERLCARPWNALSPERIDVGTLSAEIQQALPGSRLEIGVAEPDGEPGAKRITVVLRWPAGSGRADHCVRLVAWRYRQNGS